MSLPDTFKMPPLPAEIIEICAQLPHPDSVALRKLIGKHTMASSEQAYALGLADARASMMDAAREEAGHEFGLWPIGAVAVVARLKADAAKWCERNGPVAYWRHKKRGTTYMTAGQAVAQCSTAAINDGDSVQIYRSCDDGAMYVRKVDEFQDGRFERFDAAKEHP